MVRRMSPPPTPAPAPKPDAPTAATDLPLSRLLAGAAWGIGAALIWAGWMAVTRLGVTTNLGVWDLTALRFGIGGLILLPVFLRARRRILAVPWPALAGMAVGAGAPYVLVLALGMTFAPAAHAGALVPGTLPMFTALLSVLILGETVSGRRRIGLALIIAGALTVAGLGLLTGWPHETQGHVLFLCGAVMWATFTVSMRFAALRPIEAASVVSVASLVVVLPLYLTVLEPRILQAPMEEVLLQALFQGVLAGVVALVFYGRAVATLGAARGAVFAALVPVLVPLLAVPIVGESPAPGDLAGILLVTVGVFLASGARLGLPRR